MFTQLVEIMHIALPEEQLKLMEDYENAKLQNSLADILIDKGRHAEKDKTEVAVPPDLNRVKGRKAKDCKCNMQDFSEVLNKQVKLTKRNQ